MDGQDEQDLLRLVYPGYPVHRCSCSRMFANAEWQTGEELPTYSGLEVMCIEATSRL
jgi:hypothetical protein